MIPVARPSDIVLLHLSVGSPLNDLFARLPVRKALLAEFWRYDSLLRAWKGQAPTPALEMAIRDAGGLIAPLPRGSSV